MDIPDTHIQDVITMKALDQQKYTGHVKWLAKEIENMTTLIHDQHLNYLEYLASCADGAAREAARVSVSPGRAMECLAEAKAYRDAYAEFVSIVAT
jgi:hypothetical protein